jgi:hypothetical protein
MGRADEEPGECFKPVGPLTPGVRHQGVSFFAQSCPGSATTRT